MKKPSWLSKEILTAIKKRDWFKKELEKGRIQGMSFNSARNKVVRLIEKTKKEAVINRQQQIELRSPMEDLEEHFSHQSEIDESNKLSNQRRNQLFYPRKKYPTYSMRILSLLLIT